MIGMILAGGRASRMDGIDKTFLPVGGTAILARVIAALAPQCGTLLINANGDRARFAGFGLAVVPDTLPDRPGPLAGILAGLDHVAEHHPDDGFVLTVPGDVPFLPSDLVARLEDRRVADRATIVRAASNSRIHGVVALWSVTLRDALRHALVGEGMRKVGAFAERHAVATVEWPSAPFDPFFNVNTPGDLALAEQMAVKAGR